MADNQAETKTPFRIAIFISGRGSNMEAIVKSIRENNLPIEVAVVLSDKKSAKGLDIAAGFGLPTVVVKRRTKEISKAQFNIELAEAIEPYSPDLVVLAGFMRVLQPEFISRYSNRIINIHPSLLPTFPGLDVQQQAIDAGVKFSGCTVHFVTEEVDAGPIIGQAVVPVYPNDSADALAARILKQEHRLYPAVVAAIARGDVELGPKGQVIYRRDGQLCDPSSCLTSLEMPI